MLNYQVMKITGIHMTRAIKGHKAHRAFWIEAFRPMDGTKGQAHFKPPRPFRLDPLNSLVVFLYSCTSLASFFL